MVASCEVCVCVCVCVFMCKYVVCIWVQAQCYHTAVDGWMDSTQCSHGMLFFPKVCVS